MPQATAPIRIKKPPSPEILLAGEVLARVRRDNAGLAKSWRKRLPALAMRMAKNNGAADPVLLEQMVRENWDAGKTETLFQSAAMEATQKRERLTYASVVAGFPKIETEPAPEMKANWTLTDAAAAGRLDKVRELLEAGADIHANHDAALRRAAANGDLEIVRYLLEKDGEKANIHANHDAALSRAAGYGHLEIVRYLLEKDGEKADIHANHDAALRRAADHGHFEVAHYLLEMGANRKALNPYQGQQIDKALAGIERWRKMARQDPPIGLWNYDPESLNPSTLSACADMLRQEGYSAREANKYAYQAVRLFGDEQQVLHYLQRWGVAGKQPLHDVVQMISCPNRKKFSDPLPRWNRKEWADAVMVQGPKMAKLVKFADKLDAEGKAFVPVRANDGKFSLALTMQEAAKFAYPNAAEHPELAALCLQHAMDQEDFDFGLKAVKETPQDIVKNIPDITIAGEEFGMPGHVWRRLSPHDLRGLVLGEYTGCCQHIGGMGKECAAHGYRSPDGGFYVLERGKRIIGQS